MLSETSEDVLEVLLVQFSLHCQIPERQLRDLEMLSFLPPPP